MKKFATLLFFLVVVSTAGAQPSNPGFISATESDGSPDCYGYQLKFGNGTVTDNNDGSCSISSGSGSGTVNSGLAGFFGYYPADGTTIDDQGVLYTDGTNVGIGSTAPTELLDVVGSTRVSGVSPRFKADGSSTPGFEFYLSAVRKWLVYNDSTISAFVWKTNTLIRMALMQNGDMALGGTISDDGVLLDGATMVLKSGNVGIGSTSPQARLTVQGTGTTTGKALIIQNSSAAEKVTILDNGNLGIGTSAPTRQLNISGVPGSSGGFQLTDAVTGQSWSFINGTTASVVGAGNFAIYDENNALTRLVVTPTGNVGIGTTGPSAGLNVAFPGSSTLGATTQMIIGGKANGSLVGERAELVFRSWNRLSGATAAIGIVTTDVTTNELGDLYFAVKNTAGATSPLEIMRITSGGNIGIGTTGPVAPLSVTGHLHSHGTAPIVASNDCGTTSQGTVVAKSTDVAGSFTVGTLAVTSCAVTFNGAWTNAPNCVAVDDSNIIAVKTVATTTKLTVSSVASMSGDVISYICIGNE